jgi:hypothetical protein
MDVTVKNAILADTDREAQSAIRRRMLAQPNKRRPFVRNAVLTSISLPDLAAIGEFLERLYDSWHQTCAAFRISASSAALAPFQGSWSFNVGLDERKN